MQAPVTDSQLPRRITTCLERAPLFGDLDRTTRLSIAARLERVQIPGGSTLFRAGDPGDALYIVLNGRLAVRGPGQAEGRFIAELGAADIVGEMSLIGQRRRSNDVVALRDSELLKLGRVDFDRLTREHPAALDGLMHTLVERVSTPPRLGSRRPRTLAIMPRSSDTKAGQALVDQFVTELAAALRVSGARIRIVGPADVDKGAGWFSELEDASDYVLYRCDGQDDAWSRLCHRQADRIIEVARLDEQPVAPLEINLPEESRSLLATRELILLRPSESVPSPGSTRPWLDLSPETPHHHASLGSRADFGRLARLMTGRAVGIVMAGGGARGFAHIGVVRALREAHVPVDLIGGTSMGAVVAAGVAAGWTNEELRDRFHHAFVGSNPLSDYTIPFVSLFSGRGVAARLRAAFGTLDMEDLPLSMFCIGANLTTSQAHFFRRGPLLRRLRATVAIPGVLPPVIENGEVFVDGGVIDNFPVQAMRTLGRGPVIGIDIETGGALAAGADLLEPWSASEFMRRMIWKREQTLPFPSIVRILLRSALVASSFRAMQQRNAVDLLILPPMLDFDLLDWSSFERAIEVGYEAAHRRLEEIRDTELAGKLFWP